MTKIDQIKQAIHEANLFRSKLSPEALAVPSYTSLKIRHLLNNLGSISTNYYDCGSHRGGSLCSTLFNNPNIITATSADNFTEFNEGSPMQDLLDNVGRFKSPDTQFNLIMKDCWTIRSEELPSGIDMYLYDCGHGREEQRDAVTHFLDAMTDEFIFIVDDYNGIEGVKEGTQEGIRLAELRYKRKILPGFTVLYEQQLWDGQPGNNMGWHNGLWIALCNKV